MITVNKFPQGETQKSWVEKAWCLYLHCYLSTANNAGSSAGLTIAANVAIATCPAVLYVKLVINYMQGWILECGYPRQTLRAGALCFASAMQKLYSQKAN